jgi:RNA-directed DNA polymerase
VVRYADDFVVLCEIKEDAGTALGILKDWLAHQGLAFSEEKTRIVHLTQGFDFLGFNVRRYPVTHTRTGYKLLIKPSNGSIRAIQSKLRHTWEARKGSNVTRVVAELNPIVRGWATYYRTMVASRAFSDLDGWMFTKERNHTRYAHPTKPWYWRKQRYWGQMNPHRQDNWVFGDKHSGHYLLDWACMLACL